MLPAELSHNPIWIVPLDHLKIDHLDSDHPEVPLLVDYRGCDIGILGHEILVRLPHDVPLQQTLKLIAEDV